MIGLGLLAMFGEWLLRPRGAWKVMLDDYDRFCAAVVGLWRDLDAAEEEW
jgi:hypothetical protein